MSIEEDLVKHATNKVRAALHDVLLLEDDLTARARIALMASTVCIGTAAANLSVAASRRGQTMSVKEATLAVLSLLELNEKHGADAVVAKLSCETAQSAVTGSQPA